MRTTIADLPWLSIWIEVKSDFQLFLYLLTLLAVIGGLLRIKIIAATLRHFLEARGPLWALQNSVSGLQNLEPTLNSLNQKVEFLGKTFAAFDEKLVAAQKQIAALQVESVSNRTDAFDAEEVVAEPEFEIGAAQTQEEHEEHNWQALRSYWRQNAERIEFIIDAIPDGRRKAAYDRLPRTGYDRIISRLETDGLISKAASEASLELNKLFNSYRPRNRLVPDEIVAGLAQLSKQLDLELAPYSEIASGATAEHLVNLSPVQRDGQSVPNGAEPFPTLRPIIQPMQPDRRS